MFHAFSKSVANKPISNKSSKYITTIKLKKNISKNLPCIFSLHSLNLSPPSNGVTETVYVPNIINPTISNDLLIKCRAIATITFNIANKAIMNGIILSPPFNSLTKALFISTLYNDNAEDQSSQVGWANFPSKLVPMKGVSLTKMYSPEMSPVIDEIS